MGDGKYILEQILHCYEKLCIPSQNFCVSSRNVVFLCESCFTLRNFAFAPKTFVPHKFCNPPINSFYSQIFRVSLTTLLYPWDTVHSQKNWFPQETLRNLVFSQLLHFPPKKFVSTFASPEKCSIASLAWSQETLHLFAKLSHFPQKTLHLLTKALTPNQRTQIYFPTPCAFRTSSSNQIILSYYDRSCV